MLGIRGAYDVSEQFRRVLKEISRLVDGLLGGICCVTGSMCVNGYRGVLKELFDYGV